LMKILDTAVLVDIDRGVADERVERLDKEGRHAVSVVTVTELLVGVERRYGDDEIDEARKKTERLLSRFDVVPVTRPIASEAGSTIAELRDGGFPLHDLHDVYVASTAKLRDVPVLTANVDHFERIKGVDVVDWNSY
jgi:tRNA(fMet)-specific endonuclease VapC